MLDINRLEKKWYHYKFKKVMFPVVGLSLVTFTIAGTYYAYSSKDKLVLLSQPHPLTKVLGVTKEVNQSKSNETIASILPLENIEKEDVTKKREELSEELSLEPIIPIIDMEKEEKIKEVHKVAKSTKRHSNLVKAKPNTYLTAKELAVITKAERVEEVQPHVTKKMKFQSTTVNYFETMERKFSKSKKPREALLLANAYYKDKKYEESEKWALTANKLNSSIEESWFLFAKSKAKLGKKREALKILVSYYKKSHSHKAKELIGQIKTGKI